MQADVAQAVEELVRSRVPLARAIATLPDDLRLGAGGLGMDSIALVELLLDCEQRFGIAVQVVTVGGDEQSRAAAFRRALDHLQAGGFVVSALDVAPGPRLGAPCLGRKLELARGPFALARLAGVAIVPLAARWRRGGVEAVVGEAFAPAKNCGGERLEAALAAAAAAWLERYLLGSPAELSLGLLRFLLAAELRED